MKIFSLSLLAIALLPKFLFAAPTALPVGTNKNTWTNCTVSSVVVLTGNKLMVDVSGCADATYSLFYIVDPMGNFGYPTSIEELGRYEAMLLTAISTGKTITVNWSWNGYGGGSAGFPVQPNVINWMRFSN